MSEKLKSVVIAPLDPVHDVGVKLISRALSERGHSVTLLPPDLTPEEIVSRATQLRPDFVMVGRTISYGTAEVLAKFVDLCDSAGLRKSASLVLGGMSVRPEMAQELGFDAGFGPDTVPSEVADYVEGKEATRSESRGFREKTDLTSGFSYTFRDKEIGDRCLEIARRLIAQMEGLTSDGVERAALRMLMHEAGGPSSAEGAELRKRYASLCGGEVRRYYDEGLPVSHTRPLTADEISRLQDAAAEAPALPLSQKTLDRYNVMIQYGTGCPVMDSYHIKVSLAWGARGVIHFDPSWGARAEGLLDGAWSHQHDGTVLTLDNLNLLKKSLYPGALWQVRAHRGLNTPETVVLAQLAGADLTKINLVYGSLGAGTDPTRLCVDGVEAMRLAAKFKMPYDVVTNEELCGVPARKAFAGMLVVATAGRLLGGKPILQPLFANSPEALIQGFTKDNLVDFNAAKMVALRDIIDAPIWPGAPVGFMTQSQDRSQSVTMTALHAALALTLGSTAVTIASSDEAYAGGPISAQAKVDTLKATAGALQFMGSSKIEATGKAYEMALHLRSGIMEVLDRILDRGDFVASLYEGILGDRDDGAYPGRAGQGTVRPRLEEACATLSE
ncbi:MAG: cobalamin B12-binding domain-containing protein [Bacillota bacterium]